MKINQQFQLYPFQNLTKIINSYLTYDFLVKNDIRLTLAWIVEGDLKKLRVVSLPQAAGPVGCKREKRAWVLLSFVLFMLEKWEKSNGGVGLGWPATKRGVFWVHSMCLHVCECRFRVETSGQFPLDTKVMCAMTLLPLCLLSIKQLRFIYNKTIGIYDIILTLILFYYY